MGSQLASELSVPFIDGDDLHPVANVAKMSAGIALTDEDRTPWLQATRQRALEATSSAAQSSGETAAQQSDVKQRVCVIACSALRRSYRDVLRGIDSTGSKSPQLRTFFIYLHVSAEELHKRMRLRASHFMKEAMLRSQLDTLEEPGPDEADAVTLKNKDDTSLTPGLQLPPRELSIADNPALQGADESDAIKLSQQALHAQWTIQLSPGSRPAATTLGLPQTGAAAHPCMPPPPHGEESVLISKQAWLTSLSAAIGYMRSELNDEFSRVKDALGADDVGAPSTSMQTGSVRQAAGSVDGEEEEEEEEDADVES